MQDIRTPEQIENTIDQNDAVIRREMFKRSWKTRSETIWSGGITGLAFGALIGLATAAAAVVAGPAASVVLPIAGAMAVAGMMTGVAGFTAVASPISSVSGSRAIQMRKDLQDGKQADNYQGQPQKGSQKLINWKNVAIFATAGLALGGLMLATGGSAAVLGAAAGVAGGTLTHTAITAMTLTACTAFGAIFGIDIGTIGANVTEFMDKVFTGKSQRKDCPQETVAASCPQPTAFEKVSPEDMARINERASATASSRTFVQNVNEQQQSTLTGLQA